jgi:diguanylate cyclase (GGDEF)-like protein
MSDEHLVEEARDRRPRRPSARDLGVSAFLAAFFLGTAVGLGALLAWNRPLSIVDAAVLVVAYAVVSRVEFEVGPGSAVPIQLAFVPMLFVLPLALVPTCVAAGYLLGALPDYLAGRAHPTRFLVILSSSWFSVGPVVVLSAAGSRSGVAGAAVLVAALGSQLVFDGVSSSLRERLAFGHSPRSLLPSFASIWSVDVLLAPIGLLGARHGQLGVLLVLPLALLLHVIARERQARIDRALTYGRAYRGAFADAHHDELCKIGNRRKLVADMDRLAGDLVLAVYDLNGFKDYNDRFGHPAGDALLQRLAGRLSAVAHAHGGEAYRLGGDEFCVVAAVAAEAVERLLDESQSALSEDSEGIDVSACFGAVFLPSEARDANAALAIADQRLYTQKHMSRLSRSQPHVALLEAMFERDPELRDHVRNVASLSVAVAVQLGFASRELEELALAAELHDIGKIAVPDSVLQKPGPLTAEERALMQQHTVVGQRILAAVPALQQVGLVVRATHERWDGAGYADGLAGRAIPLAARVIAVCDAFEAMISPRPYAAARSTADALDELRRCAGTQFDPEIVAVFCRLLESREPAAAGAAA